MTRRPLGKTGLHVSALGLGAGPLGDLRLEEGAAARVVHAALASGVNVIDTAPSYGASEERLGRALEGRRHDVVLVTKGGYGVQGAPDWTPASVAAGVDQALRRLRTDHVDVFLLHSCDAHRLKSGELVEPLARARAAGKVVAIGYSGDGEALDEALACRAFDVVECSVNAVDQAALPALGHEPRALAKRALANAAWSAAAGEARADRAEYARRFAEMFANDPPPLGLHHDELSLRFAAFAPGVACALVGTTRVEGVERAVEVVSRGRLPGHVVHDLAARFRARGGYPGVV